MSKEGQVLVTVVDFRENADMYSRQQLHNRELAHQTQEELEKMKTTHCIIPLPVYNQNGGLIPPSEYHNQLAGAVVELYFNLRHWTIAPKGDQHLCDVYVTDISSISVLFLLKWALHSP
jgi:hypothetical protein